MSKMVIDVAIRRRRVIVTRRLSCTSDQDGRVGTFCLRRHTLARQEGALGPTRNSF